MVGRPPRSPQLALSATEPCDKVQASFAVAAALGAQVDAVRAWAELRVGRLVAHVASTDRHILSHARDLVGERVAVRVVGAARFLAG
jgi:hypothetical protein